MENTYTVKQAAAKLGVKVNRVYALIAKGRLHQVQAPAAALLDAAEVDGYTRGKGGRPKAVRLKKEKP
jgi:excisionase family DNA binding protein